MGLSNDLVSQFAKLTNNKTRSTESTIYGTVSIIEGRPWIKFDGSDRLTPADTTVSLVDGERVTALVKDHTVTITGNVSSPAARNDDVESLAKSVAEFDTVVTNKIKAETAEIETAIITKLDGKYATFEGLNATYATIKSLEAVEADIGTLQADNATINEKLTARDADIDQLKANSLTVEVADAKYATIENLNATTGEFNDLKATYGDFVDLTTDKLEAIEATIKDLDVESLNAKYANIDFTNIGTAAMQNFYANSGLIQNVVVGDQTITGELVGVTISGDLIKANTLVADKLVIKGEDGLYYKLNAEGGATADQLATEEYQSGLHGDNIIANTITAEKIDVKDLVAFDATIGGFNISDTSIYSGVKSAVDNTTRGIYMDADGQLNIGNSNNYLKFYKDQNGNYKLTISASDLTINTGSDTTNVEEAINDVKSSVDNFQVGGTNLLPNTKDFAKCNYSDRVSLAVGSDGLTVATFAPVTELGWSNIRFKPNMPYSKVRNKTITISAMIRADSTTTGSGEKEVRLSLGIATSATSDRTLFCDVKFPGGAPTTEWERRSITVDITDSFFSSGTGEIVDGTEYYLSFAIYRYNLGDLQIKGVKIEEGTIATDWSPAPEDVDAKIDARVQTVDVMYYSSTSSTEQIGGYWSTNAPTWVDGKYIWSKTVTTLGDGSVTETTPVCITGAKGATGKAGDSGADGKGITSITEQYYLSNSKTTQNGGSWVTNPPAWSNGTYLWTRSVIVYTDGTTTYTTPVCDSSWEAVNEVEIGGRNYWRNGDFSGSRISIDDCVWTSGGTKVELEAGNKTGFANAYYTNSIMTARIYGNPFSGFTEELVGKTITLQCWIKYSDVTAGTNVWNALNIGKISLRYTNLDDTVSGYEYPSIVAANITGSSNGWVHLTGSYTFRSDVKSVSTGSIAIGLEAAKTGDVWVTGIKLEIGNKPTAWTPAPEDVDAKIDVTVSNVDVMYAQNTSSTTAPTSGWATTAPTWSDGSYIWSKTITTYANGTTSESEAVCITGAKGATGAAGSTGATGKGVKSIVEQYYLSTSKTAQSGGSWSTTAPTWSSGKYVWTRSLITYTDNTTSTTTPLCDSSWEAVNELSVGGRNLVLGTSTPFERPTTTNFVSYSGAKQYQLSSIMTSDPKKFWLSFEDDEYLTLSYDIYFPRCYKNTALTLNRVGAYWQVNYKNNTTGTNNVWYGSHSTQSGSTNKHNLNYVNSLVSFTATERGYIGHYSVNVNVKKALSGLYADPDNFTVTMGANLTVDQYGYTTGGYIKNIKLERGNRQTDWTPAPEDVTADINTAKNEAAKTATNYLKYDTTNGLVVSQDTSVTGSNVQIKSDGFRIRNGSTIYASFLSDTIKLGQHSTDAIISLCGDKGTIYVSEETRFDGTAADALYIDSDDITLRSNYSVSSVTHVPAIMDYTQRPLAYIHTAASSFFTDNNTLVYMPTVRLGASWNMVYSGDTREGDSESLLYIDPRTIDISTGMAGGNDHYVRCDVLRGVTVESDTRVTLQVNETGINPYIKIEPDTVDDSGYGRIYMIANSIKLDPIDRVEIDGALSLTGRLHTTGDLYIDVFKANASYCPYYRPGDLVTVRLLTSGYISNSKKQIMFSIPLSKPAIGVSAVNISSVGGLVVRQANAYCYGSASGTFVAPSSYTAYVSDTDSNFIRVTAVMANTTNVTTNNDTAGVDAYVSIKFS